MIKDKFIQKLLIENLFVLNNSIEMPLLNFSDYFEIDSSVIIQNEIFDINNLHKITVYKSFSFLKVEGIINLRAHLSCQSNLVEIEFFSEKLIRYIEINYNNLRINEKQFNRNLNDSKKIFNQIISLFIELYFVNDDIRLINTVLKLYDLRWIGPSNTNLIASLFMYYRNKLLINRILNNLV
jgi:hypothetical protein